MRYRVYSTVVKYELHINSQILRVNLSEQKVRFFIPIISYQEHCPRLLGTILLRLLTVERGRTGGGLGGNCLFNFWRHVRFQQNAQLKFASVVLDSVLGQLEPSTASLDCVLDSLQF